MDSDHADSVNHFVNLPLTPLTNTIKNLQDMFPSLNTAIIDRVIITCKGDFDRALEKLLQISTRFPYFSYPLLNSRQLSDQISVNATLKANKRVYHDSDLD